jgi:hypothetical protein
MSSAKGCLKITGFGCLGVIVIIVLGAGVTGLVAKRSVSRQVVEDVATGSMSGIEAQPESLAGAGRVVLDLSNGEFEIKVAPPGEGVTVAAKYDTMSFRLVDELVTLEDGSWEYRVGFRRTIPFLQSLAMQIFGDAQSPEVTISLPSDTQLDLDFQISSGGFEADFGGLWLKTADIRFDKGGFELDVSEPMREPMERLTIHGSMGGFSANSLGNASPLDLTIDCKMGGAEVDLRGEWMQDCNASISIDMGGLAVIVPRDLKVTGVAVEGSSRLREETTTEVPLPELHLNVSQNRGEVEVVRR